jgi:hypothetical protein
VITDTRPEGVDYSMVVFTEDEDNPNNAGYVNSDCGDQNAKNVAFILLNQGLLNDDQQRHFVSKFIGRMAGLDRAANSDDTKEDIMYPFLAEPAPSMWVDECLPLSQGYACGNLHQLLCGNAGQNSYKELEARWGF